MATNETITAIGQVTQDLTPFQYALLLWLILGVIVLALVFLFWTSRKYPKPEKQQDPIFKAAKIWLIFFLIYLLFAALGFISREEVREHVKYWVIFAVLLIVFYAIAAYLYKKPIPSWKLWNYYVLPLVKKYWNAAPYAGAAYARGMLFHRTIKLSEHPDVRDLLGRKQESEIVDVFLGKARFANTFMFVMIMDKYTGEDLEAISQPQLTLDHIRNLLGKNVVSSYESKFKEYATEQEEKSDIQEK